jgi:hypothetical protein
MGARERLRSLDQGPMTEESRIIGRLWNNIFQTPVRLAYGTRLYREAQEEILEKQRCLGAALRG